jgi:hypothetical protein
MSPVTTPTLVTPPTSDISATTSNVTGDINVTGPVTKSTPPRRDIDKEKNSTPPTPPRGGDGRRKKSPLLKKPEEIQDALSKIDLNPIRSRWPDVDVDLVFGEFSETMLRGTAKNDIPNPYNYRDFGKALDRWCQKRLGQSLDHGVATKAGVRNPDSPIAATPKLTPEQARERDERQANALAWSEIDSDVTPPWMFEALQEGARASPDYDPTDKHAIKNSMIRLWRAGWTPKTQKT